jgi:hypothetical protein
MSLSKTCLVALAGALALGFAGAANADTMKQTKHKTTMHKTTMHQAAPRRVSSWAGQTYYRQIPAGRIIAPGDSVALIDRAYPEPVNPPSLVQTLNVRGAKMTEFRK